jgi:hypothetical protein
MHEIAFYRYNIKSQELAKLKVFPMSPDALNLIKLKGQGFSYSFQGQTPQNTNIHIW